MLSFLVKYYNIFLFLGFTQLFLNDHSFSHRETCFIHLLDLFMSDLFPPGHLTSGRFLWRHWVGLRVVNPATGGLKASLRTTQLDPGQLNLSPLVASVDQLVFWYLLDKDWLPHLSLRRISSKHPCHFHFETWWWCIVVFLYVMQV